MIGYALSSFTTPKIISDCRLESCVGSQSQAKDLTSGSLNESVTFSFHINHASKFADGFNSNHQGSIQLFQDSQNRYLSIPMRYGSTKFMEIALPKSKSSSDLVKIKILQSQTFFLYFNSELLYSHRYQLPTFYVSDFSFLKSQLSKERKALEEFQVVLYQQNHKWTDFQLFDFILLGISIGALTKWTHVKSIEGSSTASIAFAYWPLLAATFLWLLRLLFWFMSPIDPTGATSLTPFGPSGPFFSDIFQVIQAGQSNRPYDLQTSSYPPFINAFSKLLIFLPPLTLVFFLLVVTSATWARILTMGFSAVERRKKVILYLTCIFSLPMLFGFFRGNLDLLASGLIGIGILAILKNRTKVAIISLGLAIALKYWPAIILIFLLRKIGWKSFLQTATVSAGLSIVSAMFIGYHKISEIIHAILVPLLTYTGANSTNQLQYSYSLKAILFFVGIGLKARNLFHPTAQEIYVADHLFTPNVQIIMILIVIAILFIFSMKSLHISSILLFGAGAALLSTGTSYTYRATIVLVVLIVRVYETGVFFRSLKPQLQPGTRTNFLGFLEGAAWVCILAPIDFIYGKHSLVSIESLFQPLALIFLCIVEGIYVLHQNPMLISKIKLRLRWAGRAVSNWDKLS